MARTVRTEYRGRGQRLSSRKSVQIEIDPLTFPGGVTDEEIRAAIGQIFLAKMVALLGWKREADLLATTLTGELDGEEVRRRLSRMLDRRIAGIEGKAEATEDRTTLGRELLWDFGLEDSDDTAFVPRRSWVTVDIESLRRLQETRSLPRLLASAVERSKTSWGIETRRNGATVHLPLGFEMGLDGQNVGEGGKRRSRR